jgi:hypothetical protein
MGRSSVGFVSAASEAQNSQAAVGTHGPLDYGRGGFDRWWDEPNPVLVSGFSGVECLGPTM